MDINKKIAERRAELQREAADEAERKRREASEQAELRKAEKMALAARAEKEAKEKIMLLQAQLQGTSEIDSKAEKIQNISEEELSHEDQIKLNSEVQKKIDEHMQKLAAERMTGGEKFMLMLLFIGAIVGFFFAWWIGLGLFVASIFFYSKVTDSHQEKIKAEIIEKRNMTND